MPTYDYACLACEHQFEHFQSIKADPLDKCPKCGKKKLKRLLGAGAGLIFKGTGFYITDYKKKSGGGGEAKSGGESKSSGDSKPSASSSGSKS